jgi:hypothetical protein
MSPLIIAQLIIALGPPALGLVKDLAAIWHKDILTPEEVNTIVDKNQKSYDEYIAEAKATLPGKA